MRKYKNLVLGSISLMFLASAIGVGTYLVQQQQKAESEAARPTNLPSLSLSTAASKLRVGSTFTVNVAIDSKGTSVNGADLRINYDPSKLEAININQVGDFLPTTLISGTILPGSASSIASIVLACIPTTEVACPKTGMGSLAQISFLVKASGKTKIDFDTTTAVSVAGATKNSVGRMSSLQVSVSGR